MRFIEQYSFWADCAFILKASSIIKAKLNEQNINANTTNQQPFQFNLSFHLKTISILANTTSIQQFERIF